MDNPEATCNIIINELLVGKEQDSEELKEPLPILKHSEYFPQEANVKSEKDEP